MGEKKLFTTLLKLLSVHFSLCPIGAKRNENGTEKSHMDFHAQFDSLIKHRKEFPKSMEQFPLDVQSPVSQASLINELGWLGRQDSVRPRKTAP